MRYKHLSYMQLTFLAPFKSLYHQLVRCGGQLKVAERRARPA